MFEDTKKSFSMLEEIDYSNFYLLDIEEGREFMKNHAVCIYMLYHLDWQRFVCTDGKFLKGKKLSEWYFDNFPKNNREMEIWMDRLNVEKIELDVKIGTFVGSPAQIGRGLKTVGK